VLLLVSARACWSPGSDRAARSSSLVGHRGGGHELAGAWRLKFWFSDASTAAVDGSTVLVDGLMLVVDGLAAVVDGSTGGVDGSKMAKDGSTKAVDGFMTAVDGSTRAVYGSKVLFNGPKPPINGPKPRFHTAPEPAHAANAGEGSPAPPLSELNTECDALPVVQ
jgi:hypothetical protein